ncbi:MAG: hypothetical protein KatS3mg055_3658 [Chloroflexus sp.]|uniref:response regulator n=1 Tax=Chloroflexus sp. TaxID=1904827 RepID=UPI0021DBC25B|nr:response regulator [Chloroflexus sp.]GIV91140.1 MAG: hypothetical protein KatS3mg055_3658 [Chloroflexus sp.]
MTGSVPSLRRRLFIGVISAVAGLLIVSVVGVWWQTFCYQQASEYRQQIAQAREAVFRLETTFLNARQLDQKLIDIAVHNRSVDPALIVEYTEAMQVVLQAQATLKSLRTAIAEVEPWIGQIEHLFDQYQTAVGQVIAQIEQRQRADGIEPVLLHNRRALWVALAQNGDELRELSLRLALDEQAYFATLRQEYVDNVRLRLNQLRMQSSQLPADNREVVQQGIAAYEQSFLRLVDLNRELDHNGLALQYYTNDIRAALQGLMHAITVAQQRANEQLNFAFQIGYGLSAWMIIGSVAIFVVTGWFINRYLTQPLVTLTQAAQRVASGWRETTIPLVGTDEIGTLARAVYQLTATLNQTIAGLEKRVAQRTAQLQATLAEKEALLTRELQRNRRDQTLVDLSLALNGQSTETVIYRCVVDTLATSQDIDDRIGIYTHDPTSGLWIPQVTHNYQHYPWLRLTTPPTLFQAQSSPLYIPDLSQHVIDTLPEAQGSVVVAVIHVDDQPHALLVIYRSTANAFRDDEITRTGIAARLVGQAITRVRLVTSLRQAKEGAETVNRERTTFLARFDYDIRSPLHTIIIVSETLRDVLRDQPAVAEDVGKITQAGRQLLARLNVLLDSAKIEAGMLTLQSEPFALDTLLDNVVDELMPLAQRNQNRLELKRPDHLGLMVADLNRLRQVLINPFRFIVMMTQRSVIYVHARRYVFAQREWFEVTLRANSLMLSPEQVQALLTPFVIPPTDLCYGDACHGLALSRQLCELMGGTLAIQPLAPGGTIITIRIPIVRLDVDDGSIVLSPHRPTDIVVVTVYEANLLQATLEGVGWRVQHATSLDEAISRCDEPPKALLIDLPVDRTTVETMVRAAGWEKTRIVWLSAVDLGDIGVLRAIWPGDPDEVVQVLQTIIPRVQSTNMTILVIEDEAPTRLMIRRLLESDGWSVLEATHGAEGRHLWYTARPRLVILDLMLPDCDGLTMLQELRQELSTPVIVVTARLLSREELEILDKLHVMVLQKGSYRRSDLLTLTRKMASRTED